MWFISTTVSPYFVRIYRSSMCRCHDRLFCELFVDSLSFSEDPLSCLGEGSLSYLIKTKRIIKTRHLDITRLSGFVISDELSIFRFSSWVRKTSLSSLLKSTEKGMKRLKENLIIRPSDYLG